jgi:hypothetical protein
VTNLVIEDNVCLDLMFNGIYPSAGKGTIRNNTVLGVTTDSFIKANGGYTVTGNTCQKGSYVATGIQVDPSTNTILPGRITPAQVPGYVAIWNKSTQPPPPPPPPPPPVEDPVITALKAQLAAAQASLAAMTTERDDALAQLKASQAALATALADVAEAQAVMQTARTLLDTALTKAGV